MDLLLKVLGALALGLTGLLIVGVSFLCWKWKRIKLALRSTKGVPSTICLTEETDPKWLEKIAVQPALADFAGRGFERAGPFVIEGIPGLRVLGLTHPTRGIWACVYEHDIAGTFIDICATLGDGTELSVSSATLGSEMDTRPGTEKIFLPGKTVGELFAELERRVQDRGLQPKTEASFQDTFVADYARDMAWRNGQAGLSRAEFLRVAGRDGKKYSPELLEAAFTQAKLGEMRGWESECVTELQKTSNLTVSQWREYEHRMVLFREDFHPEAYVDYLSDTVELSDDAIKRHKQAAKDGVSLQQLLEHIASEAGEPCVRLGEVITPIRAEIYGLKLPDKACAACSPKKIPMTSTASASRR